MIGRVVVVELDVVVEGASVVVVVARVVVEVSATLGEHAVAIRPDATRMLRVGRIRFTVEDRTADAELRGGSPGVAGLNTLLRAGNRGPHR
jgi:hypothetical protein